MSEKMCGRAIEIADDAGKNIVEHPDLFVDIVNSGENVSERVDIDEIIYVIFQLLSSKRDGSFVFSGDSAGLTWKLESLIDVMDANVGEEAQKKGVWHKVFLEFLLACGYSKGEISDSLNRSQIGPNSVLGFNTAIEKMKMSEMVNTLN